LGLFTRQNTSNKNIAAFINTAVDEHVAYIFSSNTFARCLLYYSLVRRKQRLIVGSPLMKWTHYHALGELISCRKIRL